MHPALSVIVFTTASGAGYGLLALLGIAAALGRLPAADGLALTAMALALALISGGLLSSTLHLGRPERAWRAVSQWRSSWLSREGVAAILTYLPAGLFGIGWALLGETGGIVALLGLIGAAMAAVTVACTGMIYASLKPIHQWHNRWVVPNYLALGLMTGALWLDALLHAFGARDVAAVVLAALSIPLAVWLKERYWRFIDTTPAASTPESATGLGGIGKVRLLDPPHTSENYLLQEMGFRIARKHAVKLRRIALALAFGVPLVLTLLALVTAGAFAALCAILAAPIATAGVLVERWLFFAEAKHTVTLYYGAQAA